jgi:hypothetical protein
MKLTNTGNPKDKDTKDVKTETLGTLHRSFFKIKNFRIFDRLVIRYSNGFYANLVGF